MSDDNTLPAGTIIRIGQGKLERGKYYADGVIGLEFKLQERTSWGAIATGPVVKNPNGWHSDSVRHTLDPNADTIIFRPNMGSNRAAASFLLKKEEV